MLRRNPDAPVREGVTPEQARAARVDDGVRRLRQAHNREVTAAHGPKGVGRK